MHPLTPDYTEEALNISLFRQATETLARHMVLASDFGDVGYALACRAEIARREQGTTEQELEAA